MSSRTMCLGCLHDIHAAERYDDEGECDKCGEALSTLYLPVDASQWVAILRDKIFREVLKKKEASYVALSARTVVVSGFPLELLENWMDAATSAGRESTEDWDKEAPRTKWRAMEHRQSWLFTTIPAVAFICSFQTLVKCDGDRDGAGFDNHRQTPTGDILSVCPPFEVTASQELLLPDVLVNTVTFRFATCVIPNRKNTWLRLSGKHPVHTYSAGADLKRWPHLPFYDSYEVYLRWRIGRQMKANKNKLLPVFKRELLDSIALPTWKASEPPGVVASRLPSDAYTEATQAVPWQHPGLTAKMAAYKTSGDAERLREARSAKAAAEAREYAKFNARKQAEYERFCYEEGKRITERTLSKPGSSEATLLRSYNYSRERDARFNGEHARAGYDGVGPDPCDPHNTRGWMKNFFPTWQQWEKHKADEKKREKAEKKREEAARKRQRR